MYGAKEGKEDGWEFLKKLDKNMGQYIKSGSRPAKMTAQGELLSAAPRLCRGRAEEAGIPGRVHFPGGRGRYEVEANAF